MQEVIKIIFGIVVLLAAIPMGNWIAKVTNDEAKSGQVWFKLLTYLSLIGGFIGLIVGNDVILFTFFFIAILTSRSIIRKK